MISNVKSRLLKRERDGNLRQLYVPQSLIDFSSNDYLGLARSPRLADLVGRELFQHQSFLNHFGSTGSRLVSGNSCYMQDLENSIARFHGFETGLLFNCGYMANLGLLSTLAGSGDTIFFDAHVHASTYDGIRLSKAKALAFKHNDALHLESRLKKCKVKGDRFICVESIYSTDGSIAPLSEICRLAKTYGAHVIVDEAHAVGAYGFRGRGLVGEMELCSHVFAQVITFGKALGTHGAIILGDRTLKQGLINFATSYIYTTALPMHSLAAIKSAYDLFPSMEKERAHLQNLIQLYRSKVPSASKTHIQSFSIKGNQAVRQAAKKIGKAGFDVRALMSPTVQRGREILRICLHSFNTDEQLKVLLEIINSFEGEFYE